MEIQICPTCFYKELKSSPGLGCLYVSKSFSILFHPNFKHIKAAQFSGHIMLRLVVYDFEIIHMPH